MTFITVDIDAVRQRQEAARASLAQAQEAEAAAGRSLEEARQVTAQAERVLALAIEVEQTILNSAVKQQEPGRDAIITVPPIVATATIPAVVPGPLASLSTRKAIVATVTAEPARIFEMEELVSLMKSRGFQGTHNAVHVQLSRMASKDDEPVERIRTGFYRARVAAENSNGAGAALALAQDPGRLTDLPG